VADSSSRIAYVDWVRGLACLLMFQTHSYDAWLSDAARQTTFFHQTTFFQWTRLGGSLPAPIFLFLAGVAVALVCDRATQKGAPPREASRNIMRRGWQIFGLALIFRLQEFLLGWPSAPWTDLLRVDVLNIIGLSLVLLGGLYGLVWSSSGLPQTSGTDHAAAAARLRARAGVAAALIAAAVAAITPPLWTTLRPRWLPWFLESYVNGVHIFGQPQVYLFPLFPWAAFAFAGFAAGCFLASPWSRRRELLAVVSTAAGGAILIALGLWLDSRPQLYAVYDFWHSSPNYFMIRTGTVAALLLFGYFWCRWAPSLLGFSPVIELGKQSLLVYWVSIELTYGGLSIVKKNAQDIPSATRALFVLTLAMVALAAIRNRTQGRPLKEWFVWRSPAGATRGISS
jgi:uncharacterized membrane protein